MFRQDYTCPALLFASSVPHRSFHIRAITHYGRTFQSVLLSLVLSLAGCSNFARHYFRNLG